MTELELKIAQLIAERNAIHNIIAPKQARLVAIQEELGQG
jgi:hypothetical protein